MKKYLCLFMSFLVLIVSASEIQLRFGVVSDNHMSSNHPHINELTRKTFELFQAEKVDFFVDSGDVINTYQPQMMKLWRRMYEETFPVPRPDFLMIPAAHDFWKQRSKRRAACLTFVKLTGSGAINPVKTVKGYHFVSIAQRENPAILKRSLAAAAKQTPPGKPIFVVVHVPPQSTTRGSKSAQSGDPEYRKILNSYPQAVVMCGHTHQRLRDPQSVWQGEFTAVNGGTLFYTNQVGIANPSQRVYMAEAAIWDVYKDKIIIRRFNINTGKELSPERRRIIPLPFVRETAPFRLAAMKESYPDAAFSNDGQVEFSPGKASDGRWGKLTVPVPENPFALYKLRLHLEKQLADGTYVHHGLIEFVTVTTPEKNIELSFPAGYLEANTRYRFRLEPFNFYDRAGKSLYGGFEVKSVPWKPVSTAHIVRCMAGIEGNKSFLPEPDGFFKVDEDTRYLLPQAAVEQAKKLKKQLIVTVDMECIGSGLPHGILISHDKSNFVTQTARNYRESPQKQRYSFVFTPEPKAREHYIFIRRGSPAKYRLTNLKTFLY